VRRTVRVTAIIGTVAIIGITSGAATMAPDETTHPSGITILSGPTALSGPLPAALGHALTEADRLSSSAPADFGFPWVDRTRGQLVLPVITAIGLSRAKAFQRLAVTRLVRLRIERVRHSRAGLQEIMDGVIGRQTDGRVVYADYPDARRDRVILEIDQVSDRFLFKLAARYEPSAIAVLALGTHGPTSPA
jgi:hypothetical protein